MNWAGLKHNSPKVEQEGLMRLNDKGGSFNTIADLIEKTPDDWIG